MPVRANLLDLQATYEFDVAVDIGGATAEVTEGLRIVNCSPEAFDTIDLFVLANQDADGFREFALESVTIDGRETDVAWTESGLNMVVALDSSVRPGEATRVVVRFRLRAGTDIGSSQRAALSIRHDLMQFLHWYPVLSDGHGVHVAGDPASAAPAAQVTYRIRSEQPATIAVPGTIERRTPTAVDGRLDGARDFAFAVSPSFERWSGRGRAGVDVLVYATDGAEGAAALEIALQAVDEFGRLTETSYPGERLVVVGGTMDMESSGIVFVHRRDLDNAYELRHEIAHQWFYGLVGSDQLREPWLDEAFATFLAGDLRPRHDDGYCSSLPVNAPVEWFPEVALETSWQECDSYVQTVYYKGSWMLHALRVSMGDEAFLVALREYVTTFRLGVATGEGFAAIWRRHCPGLDELLAPWLATASGTHPRPPHSLRRERQASVGRRPDTSLRGVRRRIRAGSAAQPSDLAWRSGPDG
jgi:hypothetical protein